jgi:hypothetical protein
MIGKKEDDSDEKSDERKGPIFTGEEVTKVRM